MRRRDAYVEMRAWGVVGSGCREAWGFVCMFARAWAGTEVCGCVGGNETWREGVLGVCGWGVGARLLPRTGRVPFREGFIRPFVGGGVAELDQCRILL